jgi:hypothetical protein
MLSRNPGFYADPFDILRRFVPAPLKASYRVASLHVMVQTNDFALIPTLLLGADPEARTAWDWEWKLVRDADAFGPLESGTCLSSDGLIVATMGPACLLGVDHHRREVLGFIGADVDARTYQEFLVPFIFRMMNEELCQAADALAPFRHGELANG